MTKATPDPATTTFAKSAVASIGDGPIVLSTDATGSLTLPPQVAALVREMLTVLASGREVQLEPTDTEMSPTVAAAYLNVSRPYLVKLLDEGKIPYRMVGTHRRLQTSDVMAYKRITRARQHQAMDEVVRLSEDMGLYDDDGQPPSKGDRGGPSSSDR